MLLNCGVGEDSWESLEQQGDPTSPSWSRSVLSVHRKDWLLKLKLQYFGHLMWRTISSEKTLMLGKIEGGRRRGETGWDGWMASPTHWTWVWVGSGSWWCTGTPNLLQSMVSKSRTQLSNWTEVRSVRVLFVLLGMLWNWNIWAFLSWLLNADWGRNTFFQWNKIFLVV